MKVTWRPYVLGDEHAINQLYFDITGRKRSIEQWTWQWGCAPGGPGDIFLIEVEEDGQKRLVGHHGIMPVRFVFNGQKLLFGKTENTMVLPEYRSKILYPRFERRFQNLYEPRYDALFSTIGPRSAIRQRLALGYKLEHDWVRLYFTVGIGSISDLAMYKCGIVRRCSSSFEGVKKLCGHSVEWRGTKLRIFCSTADSSIGLLGSFASSVQSKFVEPSRIANDLSWRFWDNPYSSFVTFLVDHAIQGASLVTVSYRDNYPVVVVEDIVTDDGTAESLAFAIDCVMGFVKENTGVGIFTFSTTSDFGEKRLAMLARRAGKGWGGPLNWMATQQKAMMPRKITTLGDSKGLHGDRWAITPIVFEGR